MQDKGFEKNKNWMTVKYDGAKHHEDDWRGRFSYPHEIFVEKLNLLFCIYLYFGREKIFMKKIRYLILHLFLVFIIACDKDDDPVILSPPCSTNCEYIYLGHINEKHNAVDRRIEEADLSKYDQIWLGGDLCSETTREESTLDYVDSLFNLSSKNTHWSVGNHDVRNGKHGVDHCPYRT